MDYLKDLVFLDRSGALRLYPKRKPILITEKISTCSDKGLELTHSCLENCVSPDKIPQNETLVEGLYCMPKYCDFLAWLFSKKMSRYCRGPVGGDGIIGVVRKL